MNAVTIKHFDKLNFVDNAKKAGASEDFARVIAQELESIQESNIEKVTTQALEKELSQFVTKADLKSEIKDLELRLTNTIHSAINTATNRNTAIITIVIGIATFLIKFH